MGVYPVLLEWALVRCTCVFSITHPQCMSWMGMKKPLVNPATLEMTGDRRTALLGKAQIRAMSREIQAWFSEMFTTTTCTKVKKSYDWELTNCNANNNNIMGKLVIFSLCGAKITKCSVLPIDREFQHISPLGRMLVILLWWNLEWLDQLHDQYHHHVHSDRPKKNVRHRYS